MDLSWPSGRVGFLPEETSFFQDGGFYRVFSGFFRPKLEETGKCLFSHDKSYTNVMELGISELDMIIYMPFKENNTTLYLN